MVSFLLSELFLTTVLGAWMQNADFTPMVLATFPNATKLVQGHAYSIMHAYVFTNDNW